MASGKTQRRRLRGDTRVAVCIDTREGPGRERLTGVYGYALKRDWRLFLIRGDDAVAARQLPGLNVDGAILYDRGPSLHRSLKRLRVITVEASARNLELNDAAVFADDTQIARMAAAHLIDRGFEQFAYCGMTESRQSRIRGEEFQRHLRGKGLPVTKFEGVWPDGEVALGPLIRWLRRMRKPCGVLASDDRVAERVLAACRLASLSVPEEIGVLGTSNDELLCELTHPRLSSVALPTVEIGRRAAEILGQLMEGRRPKRRHVALPPMEVVVRASTDRLSTTDPEVAVAIRFIRANGRQPIGTDQVADAVRLARRTLERRFSNATGRTVHDFLVDERSRFAKQFLRHSDAPLNEVARHCGYLATSAFTRMFTATTGCHPDVYRKRYRGL